MKERDFEDILCKYPELIEPNLFYKGRQIHLYGRIMDILFEDAFKRKLIAELKIGPIKDEHIGQILSYEGILLSNDDPTIRVILIGNRVPPNIRKSLDHHGIAWKEITFAELKAFIINKNDTEFIPLFDKDIEIQVSKISEIEKPKENTNLKKINDHRAKEREQQKQIEQKYSAARDLFKDKLFEEAKEYFLSLEESFPNYKGTKAYLKNIENKLLSKEFKSKVISNEFDDIDNFIKQECVIEKGGFIGSQEFRDKFKIEMGYPIGTKAIGEFMLRNGFKTTGDNRIYINGKQYRGFIGISWATKQNKKETNVD